MVRDLLQGHGQARQVAWQRAYGRQVLIHDPSSGPRCFDRTRSKGAIDARPPDTLRQQRLEFQTAPPETGAHCHHDHPASGNDAADCRNETGAMGGSTPGVRWHSTRRGGRRNYPARLVSSRRQNHLRFRRHFQNRDRQAHPDYTTTQATAARPSEIRPGHTAELAQGLPEAAARRWDRQGAGHHPAHVCQPLPGRVW